MSSSPVKSEDAQMVQRFKTALQKNLNQIEGQVKEWETQIFSVELRAKMTVNEMRKKSGIVLAMHKAPPPPPEEKKEGIRALTVLFPCRSSASTHCPRGSPV